MHKTNITLLALLFSIPITALIVYTSIAHGGLVGWFYFPAILLAVVFSGGVHSPTAMAGWSAFLSYTLLYLGVAIVCYALMLELYLLGQVLHHFDADAEFLVEGGHQPLSPEKAAPHQYLRQFGDALIELETRRRSHYVLAGIEGLDLGQPNEVVAAQAITYGGGYRHVQRLMKEMEGRIVTRRGTERGHQMMASIRATAQDQMKA